VLTILALPGSAREGTIPNYSVDLLGGIMRRSGLWWFLALCLMLRQPALAQVIWDMPNVLLPPPKFNNSTIKPRSDTWPRLDPGAVLCKTEADLLRLAASRRGEPVERPNCQLIREPTPVQIQHRVGPGRTEVSVTGQQGQDGWTDAWLPDIAPPIGGKPVRIK
jgi:hypothetical protein